MVEFEVEARLRWLKYVDRRAGARGWDVRGFRVTALCSLQDCGALSSINEQCHPYKVCADIRSWPASERFSVSYCGGFTCRLKAKLQRTPNTSHPSNLVHDHEDMKIP